MKKPFRDEGRAFAERYLELTNRLDELYVQLPFHFPTSPEWRRITREIDAETKNLRACSSDWAAYERGESA